MSKCHIVVLHKESTVAVYFALVADGGNRVSVAIGSGSLSFKTTPRKPAMRAAMEAVMLAYAETGEYDPQTYRVTVGEQPTDDDVGF